MEWNERQITINFNHNLQSKGKKYFVVCFWLWNMFEFVVAIFCARTFNLYHNLAIPFDSYEMSRTDYALCSVFFVCVVFHFRKLRVIIA